MKKKTDEIRIWCSFNVVKAYSLYDEEVGSFAALCNDPLETSV